jgi:hypothetical protein
VRTIYGPVHYYGPAATIEGQFLAFNLTKKTPEKDNFECLRLEQLKNKNFR